jgi:sterol-4alpha-carboxylate 3-dehydrogenase (decarboxylating)
MLGQRNTNKVFDAVNIKATQTLLDTIHRVGITKALVYTSSSSVIHNNITDLVHATEDAPYCPASEQTVYYTTTKAVAEKMVLDANRKHGLLTAAIRGCLLFGEDDNVMPTHIGNAKSGRSRLQVGDGKKLVDWTYTGNVAHAHVLAAEALVQIDVHSAPLAEDADMRVDGEAFVITNDEPWPFWKFIRTVGATAGYPTNDEDIWVVPSWVFYASTVTAEWGVWAISFGRRESQLNRIMVRYFTMIRTLDISKAKKRLGYRPQVSIEDGIRRAVRAYMASHPEDAEKRTE